MKKTIIFVLILNSILLFRVSGINDSRFDAGMWGFNIDYSVGYAINVNASSTFYRNGIFNSRSETGTNSYTFWVEL